MTTASPVDSQSPRIRQAERADLLAVYRIEQAAFPQPWPFSAFEQYLGEPGFLVAVDGAVVGYTVADFVSSHGRPLGHVKDIAVRRDRRGEGIGAQLLTQGLAALDRRGAASVKLEVRENNDRAIALYRRHDFVHRRTVPGYYDDGEDALVFVRPLSG
ncbi:MAG: ribosomal protein S18-alanine N-acetyltransferase [Halovenus sp.]